MVGAHRCVRGHTWTSTAGAGAISCPVCGGAAESDVAAADTPRPFVVPVRGDHDGPDSGQLTSPHLVVPGSGEADEPSFSSLVGMPTPPTLDAPAHQFDLTRDFQSGKRPERSGGELTRPEVPGYEIFEELGRGGMGVVYKARQRQLNRPVALKMILSGAHAGATERERFRREAEAVAQLQNPHIVQIFEIGEASGHPYLALEFVEGGSLAQSLTGAPWSSKEAATLVELLARAVHYAHQQGVVHRDLKPANVLLGSRGAAELSVRRDAAEPTSQSPTRHHTTPKITDFGLAKRIDSAITDGGTKTGAVMGTPSYIAPEQASGKVHDVGPPADVYSLGAILYELLTGRPPFRGESPLDTVLQVIHDDPVAPKRLVPNVPRDLDTICTTCLAKLPAKRYATALALAEDLRRFLGGEPIQARPLSAWGRGVKWAHRHPALTALAAATVIATVGVVAVLSVAYARVADAVAQKEQEAKATDQARTKEAVARHRAEQLAADYLLAKTETDALNARILLAKREVDAQAQQLREEGERTRRAAFALQLVQVAALCERDPRRAMQLLDDDTRCPADLRDFTWAYLRRLCHREDRVYLDHDRRDSLSAVAVAPNGSFVVTAGRDGPIRLWDPHTGRTWAILNGHTGRVLGLAFAPDSTALASVGADGTMRLWEIPATVLETARRTVTAMPFLQPIIRTSVLRPTIVIPAAHAKGVTCVAFAPDGRVIVTGGADGLFRVWGLGGWRFNDSDAALAGSPSAFGSVFARSRTSPTGRPVWPVWEHKAHEGPLECLAFAPGGRYFATGGQDRAARVWAVDGSMPLAEVGDHANAVSAVALTPDARTLITANNGSTPTVRLHDLATGTDVFRLTGHTSPIRALAVSPDGLILASGGTDRTVRLWDLEDGKERSVLLGHEQPVTGLAFGQDRRTVVSVGSDAAARVWLTGVRLNETADVKPTSELSLASMSGSGSPLVAVEEKGRLQILLTDVGSAAAKSAAQGPGGSFAPWSVPLASQPRGAIRATAATPDGRLVVVAADEGLYLWRIHHFRSNGPTSGGTMPLPVARPFVIATPKPVEALALDADNRTLATLDSDGVRLWDLSSVPFIHDRDKLDVRSRRFAEAAGARDLIFLDEHRIGAMTESELCVIGADGRLLNRVELGHRGKIEAVAFDATNQLLATADATGVIRIGRIGPDGSYVQQAELTGHIDAVNALSFSPDGRTLASGGIDRLLHLWDPLTGHERAALTGHTDRIIHVQFTTDGRGLVTISRSGTVKRWRAEAPNPKNALQPLPRFNKK